MKTHTTTTITARLILSLGLGVAVAACGGGDGPGGEGAAGPGAVRTAGGSTVSEEAVNHWRAAIERFNELDEAAANWTEQACEEARSGFQRANDASGGRFTEAIYMMGVVSGRCGNDEQALQYYRQALEISSTYCGARVGVALADMRANRLQQAQQQFEAAIRDDNRCTAAYVNLAIIQRGQSGQAREALNNLRRALAIESDYLPAFNQMALLYLDQAQAEDNQQMLDLAEVVCRQAQLINGNYAPIYNTWGLINVRQGNIIAALAKFERAFNLDGRLFEAYMNFGQLTLSYRGYEDAARAFTRANELRPNNYDVLLGLGAALRGLTQLDEAEAKYRAAIELDGQRPEAHYNLGLLYQDYRGGSIPQLEQAKTHYQTFVQRAGSRPQFAETVEGVTRQCAQQQQQQRQRRRRRASTDCRPGRIQQIDNSIVLQREMAAMQQQAAASE